MLIQFSVENYKSFKDKAVLSMSANSDKSHESNISVVGNNERVLNSVAIYGANAAGKTNLFKALATAVEMISSSNKLQKTTTLDCIIPYLFDEIITRRIYHFNSHRRIPFIIDAGANIGLATLSLLEIFPSLNGHAIEPNPEVYKILKQNLELYNCSNIEPHNVALSSSKGIAGTGCTGS